MSTGLPNAASLKPAFTFAEALVKRRFTDVRMRPHNGNITIGGERFTLVRSDSLYLAFFAALVPLIGERGTIDLIYTVARESGRADARSFLDRFKPSLTATKIASGLSHMAHAGLASVEVFPDSSITEDDAFFLHYSHPNTIEVEALLKRDEIRVRGACHFTSGYFAGWCTEALNVHLHAREVLCIARGDERCELIMAPRNKLDDHYRRLRHAASSPMASPHSLPTSR